ncbi:LPXTG-motif cell wall anchor domain-containing protein [Actinobacillus equuli]|nr:LPXTG-motif cell wall anchor domain-containing protein [Actinobacillus equuli]
MPDLTADLRLTFGDTPMQTAYLDQAAKYIEAYKPKMFIQPVTL